jgi:hypothetical protein
MESGKRIESYVRRAGFAVGVALVAVLAVAFRVPHGTGTLGADVILSLSPTGELGVSKPGPFMTVTGLRPGRSFDGKVTVHNQTGKRLAVRLRALPDSKDLDRILLVDLRAGATRLYRGPLGGLRNRTRAFDLDADEQRFLHVRAFLPRGLERGYAGRVETVKLDLSSTVAAGRG